MTREEIREGIARMVCCLNPQECGTCKKCPDEWEDVAEQVDEILSYLHSQGLRLPNGEALIDETNK